MGKRAITFKEHQATIAKELMECRAFYDFCWHLGGAQSGVASQSAEDVDWQGKVASLLRRKTATVSIIHFGEELETLLRTLPQSAGVCLKDPQRSPRPERAECRPRAKRTRLWSNPFAGILHGRRRGIEGRNDPPRAAAELRYKR